LFRLEPRDTFRRPKVIWPSREPARLRGAFRFKDGAAMPLFLVLLILEIMLIIHAVKTGRASPWAFIILFAPLIGAIAYVVAVLVPDWFGSPQGVRTQQSIAKSLNPEKRYRALSDAVEIADTIANRAALAEECMALGRFEEAKRHFEVILSRPLGDEPLYMFGRARAQFGLGQAGDTVAILDDLRARFPDYQSAEAHLVYARALEMCNRSEEALEEYRALSEYYVGAEARVRYGLLLERLGREAEAKAWLTEVVRQFRRSPAHVQKAQAEWIARAEKVVRA
jgi:hypothetical protein